MGGLFDRVGVDGPTFLFLCELSDLGFQRESNLEYLVWLTSVGVVLDDYRDCITESRVEASRVIVLMAGPLLFGVIRVMV